MLLGRVRELQALEQLLDAARRGRSGVLALVGEPGIGKTSLLDAAAERAHGMRVLRARGVASEAQIPFAALFELLRPALRCLDSIPRPQAAALEGALALRPARAGDRFAIGAATLSLLGAYAETEPVLVLVDDVQWLDGSSGDALRFAFRRLLAEPVAVVLAAREDEPSLLDGADFAVLRLPGLDADAAAALVQRPDVARRLHRETGGNPLALIELARERLPELAPGVPVPVPTTVAEAYLQRAAALPEPTRDTLVLAAVTDRGDVLLLERAAVRLGLSVADLDPAAAAGLLTVAGGRVEFRHPLARSALYAAAPPERRRAVHRALAETLPDADADRRAWHLALAAAGTDEHASSALAQAGERAYERSAYDVASQAYERAARLAPERRQRAALLYEAADAAWLGGRGDHALSLLDDAAEADEGSLPSADLDHLRGRIALWRGPLQECIAVLAAAAEERGDILPRSRNGFGGRSGNARRERLELLACGMSFGKRSRIFGHHASKARLHLEHLRESERRSLHARVHLDRKRLRIGMSVRDEPDGVGSGKGAGTARIARGIVRNGGNRVVVAGRIGRGVVQIPNPAVHAWLGGQNARHANPIRRNQLPGQILLGKRGFIRAGVAADDFALRIENLERDGAGGIWSQVIVDDGAVRRILCGGLIGRNRRIGIGAAANAKGRGRLEEKRIGFCDRGRELAQRRDVVKNPEGAAVRRDDEIVFVDP